MSLKLTDEQIVQVFSSLSSKQKKLIGMEKTVAINKPKKAKAGKKDQVLYLVDSNPVSGKPEIIGKFEGTKKQAIQAFLDGMIEGELVDQLDLSDFSEVDFEYYLDHTSEFAKMLKDVYLQFMTRDQVEKKWSEKYHWRKIDFVKKDYDVRL